MLPCGQIMLLDASSFCRMLDSHIGSYNYCWCCLFSLVRKIVFALHHKLFHSLLSQCTCNYFHKQLPCSTHLFWSFLHIIGFCFFSQFSVIIFIIATSFVNLFSLLERKCYLLNQ